MRRTCFVSIPFGLRIDETGRTLDFDHLYREVIRPAVEAVDIECGRLDDFPIGAIWHKTLFEAILSSDIVIADLTTPNPNVYYELGIRHALRPRRTILISASGRLPGNLSYARTLQYNADEHGRLSGAAAEEFRNALQSILSETHSTVVDSPIFEFFPDLEVTLPTELQKTPPRRRARGRIKAQSEFTQSVVESPAQAKVDLEASEAEVRGAADADPGEFLTLLHRYRDLSDWGRVIALAEDAPPEIAHSSDVRQLLALALVRRGHEGDHDRAIAVVQQQIAEAGGSSEAFGMLGLIYKDRYREALSRKEATRAADDLEKALHWYRQAFQKNPRDYYAGMNVVEILLQRIGHAADAELQSIVPQVRAAVQERLQSERPDFWDRVTDVQLAAIVHDWDHAERAVETVLELQPAGWMVDSALRMLAAVGARADVTSEDQRRLDRILMRLRAAEAGVTNA